MEFIVRAVDVGSGNTKFVTGISGADIRCASFPSVAYPSSADTSDEIGRASCRERVLYTV